jgi:hypothetical protein
VSFEELDRALVTARGLERLERTEVPSLPGLGVELTRVQAILAGFEFPDHGESLRVRPERLLLEDGI